MFENGRCFYYYRISQLLILTMPILRRASFKVSVLLFALQCLSLALAYDELPIDFTLVPTTPSARVVEVVGLGQCQCDLTENVCDAGCCCDPDCTTTEKSTFPTSCTLSNTTDVFAPGAPRLRYCVSKSYVARVNLPSSSTLAAVNVEKETDDFVGQLLCIQDVNNDNLGDFFNDPGSVKVSDVAALEAEGTLLRSSSSAAAASSTYKTGGAIRARYQIDASTAPPTETGYFAVPQPSLGGCAPVLPVGFGVDQPRPGGETTCRQVYPSLSSACVEGGLLSASRITRLLLATTPAASTYLSVSSAAGDSQAFYVDLTTGVSTAISLAAVAAPAYTALGGGAQCANVVVAANITIVHDGAGTITKAAYTLQLATLSLAADGPIAVPQTFSVFFVRSGASSHQYRKSGSPGYRPSLPLLAGVSRTVLTKSAVSLFYGGLPLPAVTPAGLCSAAEQPSGSVLFLKEQAASCAVPYNLAQLTAFCQSAVGDVSATTPLPYLPLTFLNGLFDTVGLSLTYSRKDVLLGVWGDSDPSNTKDFVTVEIQSDKPRQTWLSGDVMTCSNVVTGVRLNVMYARVGAASNPQFKITYASLKYVTGSWRYTYPWATSTVQNFPVSYYINFKEQPSGNPVTIDKQLPQVVPALDRDLLYPFLKS